MSQLFPQVVQIVKFRGITAEQVAALDKVLKTEEVRARARRLRVRSSEEREGYLYEMEVDIIVSIAHENREPIGYDEGHRTVRMTETIATSRKVMSVIYDALGIFPEEESVTRTDWQ